MNVKRNVEGLRQNAQKKRQAALDRVEQGIRQLLKDGGTINFNTVAQTAGVSKAFLYKESAIKERIEQLRQQGVKSKQPPKHRASDASKDALIAMLRSRTKALESENQALRRQNEVAYGQVVQIGSLRQQVERLEAENQYLRASRKSESNLHLSQESGVGAALNSSRSLEERIRELGVSISPTMAKLIKGKTPEALNAAIDALEDAIRHNRVKEPEAFLNKAIQEEWKPNSGYSKNRDYELFDEWYKLAKTCGVVQGSMQENGIQFVFVDGEKMAFSQAVVAYPLDILKVRETKRERYI